MGQTVKSAVPPKFVSKIRTHRVHIYTRHYNGCPPSYLLTYAFDLPSKVHSLKLLLPYSHRQRLSFNKIKSTTTLYHRFIG